MPTIIELTPRRRARNARKLPMPRYRHIVRIANLQFWTEFLKITPVVCCDQATRSTAP